MARPLRLSFEGAVYHITARGNRREKIFYRDEDRETFLEKMQETFEKYSFICYAYCLMPNHYHLFIKTPLANIIDGMHYLNTSYSNWFKARHKIIGVIFQGRYKSIIVDEDSYSIKLSTYIHLNPLRTGIVDNLRKYKWSSYLDYTGKRSRIKRLEPEFILKQFDNNLKRARRRYERYVLENIDMKNPLRESYKGIVLGSEGFINRIKQKIEAIGEKRETVGTKMAGTYTQEEIISSVMKEFSVKREEIFAKKRGNIYRPLTMYLMKSYTAMGLGEIGNLFKIDYAAISQACKRFKEMAQIERKISKMRDKVIKRLREMSNVGT
jgi:REP element-mobilizing transposase RayT